MTSEVHQSEVNKSVKAESVAQSQGILLEDKSELEVGSIKS